MRNCVEWFDKCIYAEDMTYCVNARMIRPQTVNLSSHKKTSSMHVNIAQMHEHSCVVTF